MIGSVTVALVLGLLIGSFLNVCIWRLPRRESVVTPRSRCPSCAAPIRAWDNIPVVSFLLLRGRCRACGAGISTRYPVIEAANGAAYVLIVWKFGVSWEAVIYAAFVSALLVVTMIDLDHQIIPDRITLPGIVVGLAVSYFLPHGFLSGLIGLFAGGGLFYLIAVISRGGMGGGDIKLIAMIGTFLGWQMALLTIFLAALSGSVVGIYLMAARGHGRKSKVPFGPFLSLGAIVALFVGVEMVQWYLDWSLKP